MAKNGANSRPPEWLQPDDHVVFEKVHKSCSHTPVLKDINIRFKRHETAVVIGGSGAGKTTLLRLLIGLDKPTKGHIWVNGRDIVPLGDYELNKVRQKFGMVFQYAALLDSLTVLENVSFPLKEHRKDLSKRQREDKARDMLKQLGLNGKESNVPAELSGGQRKRVGLARALMLEPEILVYDEPTSGLDPLNSRRVDDLIEETRHRFSVTSVVISHDMASTFRIAHHAFLLADGKVTAHGRPDDLAYGKHDEARTFIAASGIAPEKLSRVAEPREGA